MLSAHTLSELVIDKLADTCEPRDARLRLFSRQRLLPTRCLPN